MFIPHAIWKTFIEKCADIENLIQSTVPSSSSSSSSSSISIQDLCELVKIYDMKLTLNVICLYMKPTTVLFLFELEQCVEHVFYELNQYTHDVSKKFEYFVSFLKQNCITNKSDAANILYKIYDKNSVVEYELIVYSLHYFVYTLHYFVHTLYCTYGIT